MEALVYVLSDVKQYYEVMIYNNDCLLVADIVKVSQHVHRLAIGYDTLTLAESVIGYWLKA